MRYKVCDSPRGPIYVSLEEYCKDCGLYEPLHFQSDTEEGMLIACSHDTVCKYVASETGARLYHCDIVQEAYRLVCDILDGKKDDTYLEDVRGYLGQALEE